MCSLLRQLPQSIIEDGLQCLDSRTNDFYMLQVAICWNVRLLEAADEIVAEKFDLLTRFMPVHYCESGKATIKCHR